MTKYAFVLGHRPKLSLAEIEAYFSQIGFRWHPLRYGKGILIIKADKKLDNPQQTLNQLGGTIKIVELIAEDPVRLNSQKESIKKLLSIDTLLSKFFAQSERKIFFGFSIYPLSPDLNNKDLQIFLRTFGIDIKRSLRDQDISSRFVVSQNGELTSVIISKNKILSRGSDIVIFFDKQYLAIGNTLAVQDFEDYSLRDYGRPQADARKGMLPPKLAQILINLAKPKKGALLLDPFCGSGTVLQEAMLKGLQVIGTDIDGDVINAAKENLAWLASSYDLDTSLIKKMETVDVQYIKSSLKSTSVDLVVSETTLGPPMSIPPSDFIRDRNLKKLNKLISKSLDSLYKVLKKGGLAVITLPYYRDGKNRYLLPFIDKISSQGYTLQEPFSEEIRNICGIKPTDRGTLLYERSRQVVGREVVVLKKK